MREIKSTYLHLDFTASGWIVACLRVLMLFQLLTKSVVLPKMDSMMPIAHMTLSLLLSCP